MDRRAIRIGGVVQGVGFRPFVHAVALRLGLGGFVRNQDGHVWIEVEGEPDTIDQFLAELSTRPPPLARVGEVQSVSVPLRGETQFQIEPSGRAGGAAAFVPADAATCPACVAELFDPANRRFRYPFLSCTNCGPRLTIAVDFPFDRERTTMAAFPLCPECQREYDDPADRRFHAQATACPACGPRLTALGPRGEHLEVADPLAHAVATLRAGRIVAVKGLGGYHLACDARNPTAVAELRRRKERDEKPFAVMAADLGAARDLADVSDEEADLLQSPRRPIVLLRRRPSSGLAEEVAPGSPLVGLMLPYTPPHHLLLHDLTGTALVMTSGNRSDEPIAYKDTEAIRRLTGIADFFLTHDRRIRVRCDDSVTRLAAKAELPVRRSRGHAPQPLRIPLPCRQPTLALGGQLKTVFAIGRGDQALLSHHVGDLEHYEAFRSYLEAIEHYECLFDFRPELLVHDLHPDYASTRYALERETAEPGLRRLTVQHHHAHLAACMAENGLTGDVIGVTFDGAGYGTDGTIWGGEFLVGGHASFRRAAHLRPIALPGGDQAVREPWRVGLAHLLDAGEGADLLAGQLPTSALRAAEGMICRRLNAPLTTSAGRLFDAVASLIGIRDRVSYEGQAAIELEWMASGVAPSGAYPFDLTDSEKQGAIVVDTRPLVLAVVREIQNGTDVRVIARRFHSSMAEIVVRVCCRLREQTGLDEVALSGGVFLNSLLLSESVERLEHEGFRVYRHRYVPPGDGGICLGQLVIAAAVSRCDNPPA